MKKILSISCSADSHDIAFCTIDTTGTVERCVHTACRKGTENYLLLSAIAGFLSYLRVKISDIAAIICPLGPGSFTSLRASMAIAKGMAFAYSTPVVAVSTLQACYEYYSAWDGIVVPVIDARSNKVFTVIARNSTPLCSEQDISITDLTALCNSYRKKDEKILLSGNNAALIYERLKQHDDGSGFFHALQVDYYYPWVAIHALTACGIQKFFSKDFLAEGDGPMYIRKPAIDYKGAKKRQDLKKGS